LEKKKTCKKIFQGVSGKNGLKTEKGNALFSEIMRRATGPKGGEPTKTGTGFCCEKKRVREGIEKNR